MRIKTKNGTNKYAKGKQIEVVGYKQSKFILHNN